MTQLVKTKTPREGTPTATATICPACRELTSHHAVYQTIRIDGAEIQFAGWQCDECGIEHSGS
jgi:RNase P subunit RPR2